MPVDQFILAFVALTGRARDVILVEANLSFSVVKNSCLVPIRDARHLIKSVLFIRFHSYTHLLVKSIL